MPRGTADPRPGEDDDIQPSQQVLVQAEALPYLSLDAVALDGGLDVALGDGETEARVSQPVGARQKGQAGIADPAWPGEDAAELRGVPEAPLPGEGPVRLRQGGPDQTLSRARPFARRALRTWRPPLVAIRARKPWVRLRRMLLG